MTAPVLAADAEAVDRAVDLLAQGGLVALPTETVYGLACDATKPTAVARVFEAKGRPAFNPLIAHVASSGMAAREGVFDATAEALSRAFWPGPLTLVLPLADAAEVCDLARAGLASIALRMPDQSVALDVIGRLGRPVAAPSANPSGRLSPTTAAHVAADLGERIDLILDGGPCPRGLESAVVACLGGPPALLREGSLAAAEIEAVCGPLARPIADPNAPQAPGQTLRHYAPRAALRLNAAAPEPGEAYLGFADRDGDLNLSRSGDLREAAANLFAMLRQLDGTADRIAVSPVPRKGLGAAINDRLERAAGRR